MMDVLAAALWITCRSHLSGAGAAAQSLYVLTPKPFPAGELACESKVLPDSLMNSG